ncbi:hypothetical protein DFH27DRAFT_579765 [Peziza echinospora]|nr:hypothetical protein DFH27DRAFT_579765 [Peziza echinospora]
MQKPWKALLALASLHLATLVACKPIPGTCPPKPPVETVLSECLDKAMLSNLDIEDAAYTFAIKPYNLRLPWQPLAVVIPDSAEDVSAAIKCAAAAGVKVSARSGGHSYAAFGLGGHDGGLVIDLTLFNTVQVDQATGIAAVGSGVRLGNLALALHEQGGRALPHGTCPGVGVGGHALHGGYGYASRMWGLTVDTIVALDVVLANGDIVTASATENAELFWALAGAGSSFGVVTTFHFQTHEALELGVTFAINLPSTHTTTASAKANTILAIQAFVQTAPNELTLGLYMEPGVFSLSGLYWGTVSDFNIAIAPLLASLPGSSVTDVKTVNWVESLQHLAGSGPVQQPLSGYDLHDNLFAKSIVTSKSQPLTYANLLPFFEYFNNEGSSAPVPWWVIMDIYAGHINTVPLTQNSYTHRDSLLTFQLYTYTSSPTSPYPAGGIPFLNAMVASLTNTLPQGQVKAYANYVDPTLSPAEAQQLYYGNQPWNGVAGSEGAVDRLKRIKEEYDPSHLIWNPQTFGN